MIELRVIHDDPDDPNEDTDEDTDEDTEPAQADDEDFLHRVGRRLATLRHLHGLSQTGLGQLARPPISRNHVSALEIGRYGHGGSLLHLRHIAEALNVPLVALLDDDAHTNAIRAVLRTAPSRRRPRPPAGDPAPDRQPLQQDPPPDAAR